MKFKRSLIVLSAICYAFLSAPNISYAASDNELVRSEGFITQVKTGAICSSDDISKSVEAYQKYVAGPDKPDVKDQDGVVNKVGFLAKHIDEFMADIVSNLADTISKFMGSCAEPSSFGLFEQMYVLIKPVTLTNVPDLMALASLTIWLGLAIMLFSLLFFAYELIKGEAEVDPFPFTAKFISTVVLVYYAPYFVEDILNLNNTIVHALSSYQFKLGDASSKLESTKLEYALPVAILGFIKAASGYLADGSEAVGIFGVIMIVIIILGSIFPMAKLVIWWYLRLFKLFLYAVISPLMFATLVFPKFSETGKKFTKNVVTESFSQTFLALGLLVISAFLTYIPKLMAATGSGVIGLGLALYTSLKFAEDLPSLAESLLESGGTGGGAGRKASEGAVNGFRRVAYSPLTAGRKVTGAAASTIGTASSVSNMVTNRAARKAAAQEKVQVNNQKGSGNGSDVQAKSIRK